MGQPSDNLKIKKILVKLKKLIKEISDEYSLYNNSLKTLFLLHLFKYRSYEVFRGGEVNHELIRNELNFLAKRELQNKKIYDSYFRGTFPNKNKRKLKSISGEIFEIDIGKNRTIGKILFKKVPLRISKNIQNKFHYIRKHRGDTYYDFGLFREGAKIPFAYSAYSVLDRDYLLNTSYLRNKKNILVKTRAYSFENTPLNAMSLLDSCATKFFNQETNYNYIVTAINPNLQFKGSSFLGASYYPFASTEIVYNYVNGFYSNRRGLEGQSKKNIIKSSSASLKPSSIIWMVKGIGKKTYSVEKDFESDLIKFNKINKIKYLKK